MLTLDVRPGKGLGAWTLGAPIAAILAEVRDKSDFRRVEVKYHQDLLSQDIIINLPEHGLHLYFEPASQRLRLIEIYDITRVQVKYGASVVGGLSHAATFEKVYQLCGPTYAGEFDSTASLYSLHYPGLLFLFPIPSQHVQHCEQLHAELPLEFPDDTTPVAGRICIYAGSAGSAQTVASAEPPPVPPSCAYFELVEARLNDGLRFPRGGQAILFGDSPQVLAEYLGHLLVRQQQDAQDVWSELGPPTATSTKPLEGGVLRGSPPDASAGGPDYFYHYAHSGIDVLFSGASHRVVKFVLHTNLPGHPEFNVYSKCNFRVLLRPQGEVPADSNEEAQTDYDPEPSADTADDADSALNEAQSLQPGGDTAAREATVTSGGTAAETIATGATQQAAVEQPSTQHFASNAKDYIQGLFEDIVGANEFPSPSQAPATPAAAPRSEVPWPDFGGILSSRLGLSSPTHSNPTGGESSQATMEQGADKEHSEQAPAGVQGLTSFVRGSEASLAGLDLGWPTEQAEAEADPFALDAAADPFAMEAGDGWEDDLAGRDFDLSSAPSAADGPLRDGGVATPVLDDSQTSAAAPGGEGQGDRVSQRSGSYPRTPSERSHAHTDAALHAPECGAGVVQADDAVSVGSPLADYRSSSAQGVKDAADGVITSCSRWDEVQAVMGPAGRATIHTRGACRSYVYGYRGITFEVLRGGSVASVTLFKAS